MQVAVLLGVLLMACGATAEIWGEFEDEGLVPHAELIVVGRLESGSIRRIRAIEGSWRGKLSVQSVLKGSCRERAIEVHFSDPLGPLIDNAAAPKMYTIHHRSRFRSGHAPPVADACQRASRNWGR